MEMILDSQVKEIELEKKQLQFKFNMNYYFEKIKTLSEKIDTSSIITILRFTNSKMNTPLNSFGPLYIML